MEEDDDRFGRPRRARLIRPKRKIRERKRKKRKKIKANPILHLPEYLWVERGRRRTPPEWVWAGPI
jgi:hypothetical protein